jgi:GxxExxY protein
MHADSDRLNDLSGRVFGCAVVGEYFADLLVEDVLLVEPKTVKAQDDAHSRQCTNYPNATNSQLCLLLNFSKPHREINHVANPL